MSRNNAKGDHVFEAMSGYEFEAISDKQDERFMTRRSTTDRTGRSTIEYIIREFEEYGINPEILPEFRAKWPGKTRNDETPAVLAGVSSLIGMIGRIVR
jgi:hypothetical protein